MVYEYVIYTNIGGDYHPDIEGVTLDSIAETCPDYVNHSVPSIQNQDVEIWIKLGSEMGIKHRDYLVGQLEAEFKDSVEDDFVVCGIEGKGKVL